MKKAKHDRRSHGNRLTFLGALFASFRATIFVSATISPMLGRDMISTNTEDQMDFSKLTVDQLTTICRNLAPAVNTPQFREAIRVVRQLQSPETRLYIAGVKMVPRFYGQALKRLHNIMTVLFTSDEAKKRGIPAFLVEPISNAFCEAVGKHIAETVDIRPSRLAQIRCSQPGVDKALKSLLSMIPDSDVETGTTRPLAIAEKVIDQFEEDGLELVTSFGMELAERFQFEQADDCGPFQMSFVRKKLMSNAVPLYAATPAAVYNHWLDRILKAALENRVDSVVQEILSFDKIALHCMYEAGIAKVVCDAAKDVLLGGALKRIVDRVGGNYLREKKMDTPLTKSMPSFIFKALHQAFAEGIRTKTPTDKPWERITSILPVTVKHTSSGPYEELFLRMHWAVQQPDDDRADKDLNIDFLATLQGGRAYDFVLRETKSKKVPDSFKLQGSGYWMRSGCTATTPGRVVSAGDKDLSLVSSALLLRAKEYERCIASIADDDDESQTASTEA